MAEYKLGDFSALMKLALDTKSQNELVRAVRDLEKKFLIKLDVGKAKSQFTALVEKVNEVGLKSFSKVRDNLERATELFERDQLALIQKLNKINRALQLKGLKDETRTKLQNLAKVTTEQYRKAKETYRNQTQADYKRFNNLAKIAEKFEDEFGETAWENFKKGVPAIAGDLVEGVTDAFNKLKGGDFTGLASAIAGGIGKKLKAGGEMLQVAGARRGGAGGARMEGAGKLIAGLGAAAGVIAGVVAGLGALLAILFDLNARATEFNKTILENVGGLDVMAIKAGDLSQTLTILRRSYFNLQTRIGMNAKEMSQLVGTLSDAGLTYREIVGDLSRFRTEAEKVTAATNRLGDAIENVTSLARVTGVSTNEMAQSMADYMNELGVSLDTVSGRFSEISRMAMESGFGTKRFFSMVLQATGGLSMYNTRMEETGALLMKVSKVLGQKGAAEFLGRFTKGFMNESYVDRFKRIIITGGGRMKRIISTSAEATAGQFQSDFQKMVAQNPAIRQAMGSLDLSNPKQLVQQLSRMSTKEQSRLIASVTAMDDGLGRRLANMVDLARGSQGGLDRMAQALGSLDMAGTIAATISQSAGFFGRPLHELSSIQLAAVENMTGLSGEQLQEMRNLSRVFSGNYDLLKEQQRTLDVRGMSDERFQQMQIDQMQRYGATLDRNGNIVTGTMEHGTLTHARAVTSLQEYIQAQGNTISTAMSTPLDENIFLSREIAANTLSLADILEMKVGGLLERIYDALAPISDAVGRWLGGRSREEIAAARSTQEKLESMAESLRVESSANAKRLAEQRRIAQTTRGPEAEAARKEVTRLEARQAQIAGGTPNIRDILRMVQRGEATGGDVETILTKALGRMEWTKREATRQALGISSEITREEMERVRTELAGQRTERAVNVAGMGAGPGGRLPPGTMAAARVAPSAISEQEAREVILTRRAREALRRIQTGTPAPGAPGTPAPGVTAVPAIATPAAPAGAPVPGAPVTVAPAIATPAPVPAAAAPPPSEPQTRAAAETVAQGTAPMLDVLRELPTTSVTREMTTSQTTEITTWLFKIWKDLMKPARIPRSFSEAMQEGFPEVMATAMADELDERAFEKFLRSIGVAESEIPAMIEDYMGRAGENDKRYEIHQERMTTIANRMKEIAGEPAVPGALGAPGAAPGAMSPMAQAVLGQAMIMGLPPSTTASLTAEAPEVEDFIYRGDGTRGVITPIDNADTFFGARPGGPIAEAMAGAGGGTVNINIYGGDEQRVFSVVQKALREAGIAPTRSTANA